MGNNKLHPGRFGSAVLLLIAMGCTKPEAYYQVAREQRAARQELIDILITIEDEKSMASAKTALDDRAAKFEAIVERAKALPNPPPPEVLERFKEDAAAMNRSLDKMNEQVQRIQQLKGGKEFFKQFKSQHPGLFSAVQS